MGWQGWTSQHWAVPEQSTDHQGTARTIPWQSVIVWELNKDNVATKRQHHCRDHSSALSGDCQGMVHGHGGSLGGNLYYLGQLMGYANDICWWSTDARVDCSQPIWGLADKPNGWCPFAAVCRSGIIPGSGRNQDSFSSICRPLPNHSPEIIYLFNLCIQLYLISGDALIFVQSA